MMRASSVTSVARTSLFTQRSLPRSSRARIGAVRCMETREMNKNKEAKQLVDPKVALSVAGLLAPLAECSPAQAIGREYGILEGQIFSLMHPAFMFFLLGSSIYAGYLGFQWRRTRELATEIKELKAQRSASVPPDAEGSETAPSPLDGTIKNLENVRHISSFILQKFPLSELIDLISLSCVVLAVAGAKGAHWTAAQRKTFQLGIFDSRTWSFDVYCRTVQYFSPHG